MEKPDVRLSLVQARMTRWCGQSWSVHHVAWPKLRTPSVQKSAVCLRYLHLKGSKIRNDLSGQARRQGVLSTSSLGGKVLHTRHRPYRRVKMRNALEILIGFHTSGSGGQITGWSMQPGPAVLHVPPCTAEAPKQWEFSSATP